MRQIINFQLGQRLYEGMFTVNLGVYVPTEAGVLVRVGLDPDKAACSHCALTHRKSLGKLLPPTFPRLARLPYFGTYFGPQIRWWPFSEETGETTASLVDVMETLEQHGFAWLLSNTPDEVCS